VSDAGIATTTPTRVLSESIITFSDKDLELSIRHSLARADGPITAGELADITVLRVRHYDFISHHGPHVTGLDLTGIEHLVSLKQLDLSDSGLLSDISPLASLTNLATLWLGGNAIRDLSPLVANRGMGAEDWVNLTNNNLDLSEDSADLEQIRQLQTRGVRVGLSTPRPRR